MHQIPNKPDRTPYQRREQRARHLHPRRHRLLPHLSRTPPPSLLQLSLPPRHLLLLSNLRPNRPIQRNNSIRRSNAARMRALRQPPLRTTPPNGPTPLIPKPKHKRHKRKQHSTLNLSHRHQHQPGSAFRRRRNLAPARRRPQPHARHISST